MPIAKITSKGQVTIPKRIRDDLGLKPGDDVEFIRADGGYQLTKKFRESPFAPFRGIAKERMDEMGFHSTDEYMEAIRGR